MPAPPTISLALFLLAGLPGPRVSAAHPGGQANGEVVQVRVGIVAYQDFEDVLARYERLFGDLEREAGDPPLRFRLASGTYGDVLHWLERDLVDVAVITPGVLAELLAREARQPPGALPGFRYLATIGLPPSAWSLASSARRAPGAHWSYRSLCVVRKDSPLETRDDIARAVRRHQAELLFVHPLSVSGRIAAEVALRRAGIDVPPELRRTTWSHAASLRLLGREAPPGRERVAFVWDGAARDGELEAAVRRVPFPELDALAIPQDVIVARGGFEAAPVLRERLARHAGPGRELALRVIDDWRQAYDEALTWAREIGLDAERPETQSVTLADIGRILLHAARSSARPPRLALVLSGGGAKCAFQVGALEAIEEALAALRQEAAAPEGDAGAAIDIDLVVGTSGGAINAVPAALGITRAPEGRAAFRGIWRRLDQRSIVRPSVAVRSNLGAWCALVQVALLLWIARRLPGSPRARARVVAALILALGLGELLLGLPREGTWERLGTNHLVHHAWLWLSFGVRWSAGFLLAIGAIALARELARRPGEAPSARAGRWGRRLLAFGIVALPIAQAWTILLHDRTFSSGEGFAHELAQKYESLLESELARRSLPKLDIARDAGDEARLAALSRRIVERGLLRRDLVLTGSSLGRTAPGLPSDLYFHAPAPGHPPPPFGPRGIPFARHPELLLDVVMGSGAAFPLFPPRRLEDFPRAGEHVELVDGGFAHNSPVEAAVLWGATHVIVIEASPDARVDRSCLLANATAAFDHLYAQAQRIDIETKRKVVVFTLRPEPPHLCALDFAENLIEGAIERGYRAARGERWRHGALTAGEPRFRKELGEPIFLAPEEAPRSGR